MTSLNSRAVSLPALARLSVGAYHPCQIQATPRVKTACESDPSTFGQLPFGRDQAAEIMIHGSVYETFNFKDVVIFPAQFYEVQ